MQVLSIGSWISADVGEHLIERSKLPDAISLITRGKVQLSKDGHVLGDLDAVTVEPLRAMRWQIGTLQKYLSANPETRAVLQRHLARDLAGKIGRLVTEPS